MDVDRFSVLLTRRLLIGRGSNHSGVVISGWLRLTRGHGDAGTRGRGDTGTWGHGDMGTRGHGDAGTRGRGEIFWTSPTRFDRTPIALGQYFPVYRSP
ncbi:MAG TPA: hypothetical protein V6D26_16800 [Stenomitos sp.]